MNNPTKEREIKIHPDATASAHENGIVILNAGSGRLFSLNLTGARIWRLIEEHASFETIVRRVQLEFQIALDIAREHTFRFLAELERHALIEQGVER